MPDFSLVELPADLPSDTLSRLEGTRISGKLIEIRPDRGAGARRERGQWEERRPREQRRGRDDRNDRDDRPARKPRHR
ncbi:hypothetical protein [Streptomyces sp. L7]